MPLLGLGVLVVFGSIADDPGADGTTGGQIAGEYPEAPERPVEPEPEPAAESEPEQEQEPALSGEVWIVTRVVDGDTVDVRRGSTTERVRVIGIDTPERGECGYEPAASALGALILNEEVALTPGARDDRDRYDRLLRYLDTGDIDAGLYLIEQGLAIARYDSRDGYGRHPREGVYVAADDATEHVCG